MKRGSSVTKLLTLKNISYQVKNQTIIDDVSLTISSGENVTLIGPSGSGKSTLLKLIATMISPTSGEILFHQKLIITMVPENYRQKVSYCFQQPTLFSKTVRENIAFPFIVRKAAFDEFKALSWLKEFQLPQAYIDKKVTELSGGQRQRVALIRNLIFLPEILLLDEVTTGLDETNKKIINENLSKLNQEENIPFIRVTHDNQEIQQATRVDKLIDGKLEEKS